MKITKHVRYVSIMRNTTSRRAAVRPSAGDGGDAAREGEGGRARTTRGGGDPEAGGERGAQRYEPIHRQDPEGMLQIHRAARYQAAVSATPRATGYCGQNPSSARAREGSHTQRSCTSSRTRSRLDRKSGV